MRAHVARYPEDATGWYLLADAQLHALGLGTVTTRDELYQPFDRALELDPYFAPAALHPLEVSVLLGDRAQGDPEMQPHVEAVRRALERLTAENTAG